jgi:hypothetical protein
VFLRHDACGGNPRPQHPTQVLDATDSLPHSWSQQLRMLITLARSNRHVCMGIDKSRHNHPICEIALFHAWSRQEVRWSDCKNSVILNK